MRHVFITALAALALTGCKVNPQTGEQELTEGGKAALRETAITLVSRHVRQNADPVRIEKIRAAMLELQTLPDITTVDGLRAIMQARIDAKVSDPWDRADFTHLINGLSPLLAERFGSGQLAPDAVVQLRDFLGYLAAALPPAPPKPSPAESDATATLLHQTGESVAAAIAQRSSWPRSVGWYGISYHRGGTDTNSAPFVPGPVIAVSILRVPSGDDGGIDGSP